MRHVGLNGTHLDILKFIHEEESTVSQIAKHIARSLSWTSECVSHLKGMDLIRKSKKGLGVSVGVARNELSHSLALLMFEAPMINLSKVLSSAGLAILPLLVVPGTSTKEISRRTGLSMPTIRSKLRLWRGMGIVIRKSNTNRYSLNRSQKVLNAFIVHYSRWFNQRILSDVLPEGLIVWQSRDVFLFSIDRKIDIPEFLSAGPTRMEELGYDLLHLREYYCYGFEVTEVSEEEALTQSLMTDPNNPRMLRFIKEGVKKRGADLSMIQAFGRKYGIDSSLKRMASESG